MQVDQLQGDVAHYARQVEAAQQDSDSWQQTVQHLRAELAASQKQAAEVDSMQAEVGQMLASLL